MLGNTYGDTLQRITTLELNHSVPQIICMRLPHLGQYGAPRLGAGIRQIPPLKGALQAEHREWRT